MTFLQNKAQYEKYQTYLRCPLQLNNNNISKRAKIERVGNKLSQELFVPFWPGIASFSQHLTVSKPTAGES